MNIIFSTSKWRKASFCKVQTYFFTTSWAVLFFKKMHSHIFILFSSKPDNFIFGTFYSSWMWFCSGVTLNAQETGFTENFPFLLFESIYYFNQNQWKGKKERKKDKKKKNTTKYILANSLKVFVVASFYYNVLNATFFIDIFYSKKQCEKMSFYKIRFHANRAMVGDAHYGMLFTKTFKMQHIVLVACTW